MLLNDAGGWRRHAEEARLAEEMMTKFTPAEPKSAMKLTLQSVTNMFPVPAHQTARPRILLVEDKVLVRVTVSDLLRKAGFTVIEAATADIAWRFLEASGPVDLVFSDVESPGSLDGLQLARSIRARFPSLPIVLTSGNERPGNYEGLGIFIAKPYRFELVASIISDALGLGHEHPASRNEGRSRTTLAAVSR
jgi:CheY-like chemotaxis protein